MSDDGPMANDTIRDSAPAKEQFSFHEIESKPSVAEFIANFLITTAIFITISRQTYTYISRGGKGSGFRTVLCLWLSSALYFLSNCSGIYAHYQLSDVQLPQPAHAAPKAFGVLVSVGLAAATIYLCIGFIFWNQLYTLTSRNKLYASLVTLAVGAQSLRSLPGLATASLITHIMAVTQIGVAGTARALIQPKDESASDCPRLRLHPSISAYTPTPHSSRPHRYFAATVICAVNVLVLYTLCTAGDAIQNLLPGNPSIKPYIRFSEVYTLIYLSIKTNHAAIGRDSSLDAGEH